MPRLNLGVPSPRLHAVLPIDGWTALHMSRLPGRPANGVWGDLEEPARLALMGELGSLLARIRRVPLTPEDGDPSEVLAHLRLRAKRHEAAGFRDVDGFLGRHLRPGDRRSQQWRERRGGRRTLALVSKRALLGPTHVHTTCPRTPTTLPRFVNASASRGKQLPRIS